jgi:hypothetical protein
VTVSGAVKECSQDEHVKGALEDGRTLLCLFRHRRDSTFEWRDSRHPTITLSR